MIFLEGWRKAKNFSQRSQRQTHRDHGEVPEMFSVHSVARWFGDSDTLNTL